MVHLLTIYYTKTPKIIKFFIFSEIKSSEIVLHYKNLYFGLSYFSSRHLKILQFLPKSWLYNFSFKKDTPENSFSPLIYYKISLYFYNFMSVGYFPYMVKMLLIPKKQHIHYTVNVFNKSIFYLFNLWNW